MQKLMHYFVLDREYPSNSQLNKLQVLQNKMFENNRRMEK